MRVSFKRGSTVLLKLTRYMNILKHFCLKVALKFLSSFGVSVFFPFACTCTSARLRRKTQTPCSKFNAWPFVPEQLVGQASPGDPDNMSCAMWLAPADQTRNVRRLLISPRRSPLQRSKDTNTDRKCLSSCFTDLFSLPVWSSASSCFRNNPLNTLEDFTHPVLPPEEWTFLFCWDWELYMYAT